MATRTVNTVTASATIKSAESPLDYKSGLFSYRLSLSLLKTMLKNNITPNPTTTSAAIHLHKNTIYLCAVFLPEKTCYLFGSE